jgi:copper homeostasis protein
MLSGTQSLKKQDAATLDLEVCIDSVESAIAAERGGARRVELCSDLAEGGVTPGAGLIASVRRSIEIDLFVMIRPRGGDFCYSGPEFEVMQEEIRQAKTLGADGVVLGLLDEQGNVDVPRTRKLVELAASLPVTFHRAIDMTPDLIRSLDDVVETGATRILTSGGAPSVVLGLDEVARMVKEARGRISIMPGSGIKAGNIAAVAQASGAAEFHCSARTAFQSPMLFRKVGMAMGDLPEREFRRFVVHEATVRTLVDALASVAAREVGVPGD